MKLTVLAEILDGDTPWSWEQAFKIADEIEERTGAKIIPMASARKLLGFMLVSEQRPLSAVEYFPDESPVELMDSLGGVFLWTVMRTPAEA
tara:strand:- start:691 stop:963 length:273 start_codon:yes stop_codon:yes gene_type:complete